MKRNKFALSFYRLMSVKMGGMYPCGVVEVLPGDTFQHSTSMLIRCSPLVAPVMHPVHARIHHWFVPHRLVWDDWEDFITGGPDGNNASVFPTIALDSTIAPVSSLADYLGMPPVVGAGSYPVSAIPFRAHALIYNEWYRDQDLTTPAPIAKGSGPDTATWTTLLPVAWEKDYFTTARPWTQKGPQVTLPVNLTGIGIGQSPLGVPTAGPLSVKESGGTTVSYPNYYGTSSSAAAVAVRSSGSAAGSPPVIAGFAELNELRLAFAMQRYEEARARYGSRYTEYLRYLGVRSSDARLQRPEYLGGGKQTIQFSEVLQTGVTNGGSTEGVGNLKGHGIGALRSNRYRRFFEEHGYVISILSIKPRTIYNQSLQRSFNRRVKEDFWQRELQHIGQQEILNKELYATSDTGAVSPTQEGIFGYQDRYDEYRRQESGVAGAFRTTSLDYWHMARKFTAQPVLNASFVFANPTNRIFADQTGSDTLYCMVSHSLQARRMVAGTGTSFIY